MSTSPRSPRNFFPADLTPLLLSGWQTNKFDLSIPFWEEVDGLQFTETSIRRKPGHSQIGTTATANIRGMISVPEFDTSTLYIGTLSNIYRWKLDEYTDSFTNVGSGYNLIQNSSTAGWDSASGRVNEYTLTSIGHGYAVGEILTFTSSSSGIDFKVEVTEVGSTGSIYGILVLNSGTGHIVDEVLTYNAGSSGGGFVVTVNSITTHSTWIDEGAVSTWDFGSNEASQWSFTNFGTWVLGANDAGPLVIKKSSESFLNLEAAKVSGATVSTAGTSYTVGEALTFTGGSGSSFTATVTSIGGSGGITGIKVTAVGSGYLNGEELTGNAPAGGGGSPAKVVVTTSDCPFTRVRAVSKSGPHLIAINYDTSAGNFPQNVAWCSMDDPDTWVGAADNSAGSLTLREATSDLKCIVPLGESKAIYTDSQMFILNYIGSPYYFGYETAMANGAGAISSQAVIAVDRVNYGLSSRGFFMTDGNSVEVIGGKEGISNWVFAQLSTGEYAQVVASHNRDNHEVVWSLPIGDASKCTAEVIYNYVTGTWSKRTSTLCSFTELSGTLPLRVSGDSAGNVYLEDGETSPHNTTATTRAHDFDDPFSIKELTSIRVGKTGDGDPLIEIGWAENVDDEPTFNPSDRFTAENQYKEYNIRTSGRYLFLRISDAGSNEDWAISNITIKGRIRGFR